MGQGQRRRGGRRRRGRVGREGGKVGRSRGRSDPVHWHGKQIRNRQGVEERTENAPSTRPSPIAHGTLAGECYTARVATVHSGVQAIEMESVD
jgi:hypothetical protein